LQFVLLYQAHYSTGAVAAGFTSTVLSPQTKHEAAIIEEDLVRYERVKKKGAGHSVFYSD
jgi:peptidyl-prolyl cis-trans isomerase-like protein 2